MKWYFTGAVLFCAGVSMWALGQGQEFWSAFWAMLAVVNSLSYKMHTMPAAGEPG